MLMKQLLDQRTGLVGAGDTTKQSGTGSFLSRPGPAQPVPPITPPGKGEELEAEPTAAKGQPPMT